jgi:Domain of unknown function (DUF3471)
MRSHFGFILASTILIGTPTVGYANSWCMSSGLSLPQETESTTSPREGHLDPTIFDGYVGVYQVMPSFAIRVTREGDHLFEQATNQSRYEMLPKTAKEYSLKDTDAQITFVTDVQGHATELILHQGGSDIHAPRVKDSAAAPKEYKEVSIDPKLLTYYVGTYEIGSISITITKGEGDHLFEQATHQSRYEMFPKGDKEYFLKDTDAQITFVTDVQGQATELILHQGGYDLHASKIQESAAAPKEHKAIQVDPKLFDGYVGLYQLSPDVPIKITREGDQIFSQMADHPKHQIFPESNTDFFMKEYDTQFTFVTDGQGRANELIVHRNGIDQHAKRSE